MSLRTIYIMLTKTPLLVRVVSLYVLVCGVVTPLYVQQPPDFATPHASVQVVSEQLPNIEKQKSIQGTPNRIGLPRIGLELDVIEGGYDNATRTWTLTDDKVQYATMTKKVGEANGQTLLYGHNTAAVLEPVRHLSVGDELIVYTDNNHTLRYVYTHDRFVVPTDTSVLYEMPEQPRLVLMTCEGFLSDTRRLLYFDLQEVM